MIELYGYGRYMNDMGGAMVHEDEAGRLWRLKPRERPAPRLMGIKRHMLRPQPDDIAVVEVVNATAEPDGSHKTYWLRVPPEMRTAKQAVAWTYGMTPEQYDKLVVRT
jgi:hypothetical protein